MKASSLPKSGAISDPGTSSTTLAIWLVKAPASKLSSRLMWPSVPAQTMWTAWPWSFLRNWTEISSDVARRLVKLAM